MDEMLMGEVNKRSMSELHISKQLFFNKKRKDRESGVGGRLLREHGNVLPAPQ